MVTSVPSVTIQAAPSKDTEQEYDYAKMYSLKGEESGEYIADYYKDTDEEESKRGLLTLPTTDRETIPLRQMRTGIRSFTYMTH